MVSAQADSPSPARGPRAVRVVAAVVMVALLVGGAAGAAAGMASGGRADSGGLPEPPNEFPDGAERYLPEVAAGEIETWITGFGWECEEIADDRGSPSGGEHWVRCTDPQTPFPRLFVEYDDDTRVRVVTAGCQPHFTMVDDYCEQLFSLLADTAFANRPDLREQARTWGQENAGNDAVTVLGGVRLKASLDVDQELDLRVEG